MKKFIVKYTDCRLRTVIFEANSPHEIDEKMQNSTFFNKLEETSIITDIMPPQLSQIISVRQSFNIMPKP